MAPILPLPPEPPQVASLQTPPPAATPSRFKDLNPAQARWLEVLEKHGIFKTNPASQYFGPEQAVRREELLMSEARIIELMVRRDQEQQAIIDRLRGELAQLRSVRHSAAQAPPEPSTPTVLPGGVVAEQPATIEVPRVNVDPAVAPLAVRADTLVTVARPGLAMDATAPTAVVPALPLRPASEPLSVEPRLGAGTDLDAIVRHRGKLRQFPRLQRFLEKAAHLDPKSASFEAYVGTYLTSAGMTAGMLAEAARQAAWYDVQASV
ncbi:MAG: hypothetical protein KME03_07330 [Aphanocapsa lilacina HA4352-LM1]|nr:hypothetical protein [Aphanocapsa lilacina HA4352-LM1]